MTIRAFVIPAAIALFVLNVADYFTTMWALSLGGIELNPVMAPIISTPLTPFLKVVVVGVVCFFIARKVRFTPGVVALLVVTSFYAAVVSWNTFNLVRYYS